MKLIDTSIWVDHIRAPQAEVLDLLDEEQALMHPFVFGEIALGNLARREATLSDLGKLPQVGLADNSFVQDLIERERLYGSGIGYVDAHLLASVVLTSGAKLWTRDRALHDAAERLGVAA